LHFLRERKDFVLLTFVLVSLFFFILCLWVLSSSGISILTSPLGYTFIAMLSNLNLIDYRSYIGGHQAHFQPKVWIVFPLFIPIVYSAIVGFLINRRMNLYEKIRIRLPLRIFTISIAVLVNFYIFFELVCLLLWEIERFAYAFFVPQI